MRWLFNEFTFDSSTRLLTIDDEAQLLEPKVAQLLTYFLENQQQDINRDQLLNHVWNNQIVTENAINRVVGLLRKAVSDENKIKHTIVTVPKVGYRFIAHTVLLPECAPQQSETNNRAVQTTPKLGLFLKRHFNKILIIIISAIVTLSAWQKQNSAIATNPKVEPVTRLSANQYDAHYANEQDRLIYSSRQDNFQALFLTSLPNIKPQVISKDGGHATQGRWSNDDSTLIYLFKNDKTCEFHQVDFINKKPQAPRTIYQCPLKTVTNFAISHDNQTLYFVKKDTLFAPYQVFSLHISDGLETRLPQPKPLGKGNHQLNLSPNGDDLLLLSNQRPGQTSFYRLNLSSMAYTKLLDLNYFVNHAIWGHKDNSIVHHGPHPSSQLMINLLDGNGSQVLVSDTRRINSVTRINNQVDYAFSSYIDDNDIVLSDYKSAAINSSVTDFLPALSPNGAELAFISKRSGMSRVWLYHLKSQAIVPFDPAPQGRRYLSLQWSQDNKQLLANTSNELIIFDAELGIIDKIIPLELPAYNAGWMTNKEIAFSYYQDNHWQLNYYNLETNMTIAEEKKWAFVLSSPKQQLFFTQDMQAYDNKKTKLTALPCRFSMVRRKLTAQLDGKDLYCQSNVKSSELVKVENLTKIHRNMHKIGSMGFIDFSISNKRQALTKLKSTSSDIMRTRY